MIIDKVITNANVVLENGIIWDGTILLSGNKIVQASKEENINFPDNAQIIDAEGAYVGPGFVDIHVHGGNGFSTYEQPEKAADYFLQRGTTTLLAAPAYFLGFDELIEAIRTVKKASGKIKILKGLYMEGPYTNPDYGCNAPLNKWRGPIDKVQYKAFVDEAGAFAKVWTIAPEREGIKEFLEYTRKVNPDVIFAIGHSEATPEQIRSLGTKYRPKISTHIMDATGIQNKIDGIRGCGPDEYCMSETDMYAELISDSMGVHVPSDLQRMIINNKGTDRVVLITDSTCEEGTPREDYVHAKDLNFDNEGGLAGSRLTMDKACRNIMSHTNCGIAQAFVMASLNGARVIGMDDEIGSIEPGKKADLVFVDDKFNVKKVMLDGEICKF